MRVRGPLHPPDTQGTEQMLLRERPSALAGRLLDNRREQERRTIAVFEPRARHLGHGQIQHELNPVVRLPHLLHALPAVEIRVPAFQAGSHGEQIFQRHGLLGSIQVGNGPTGEKLQNRLLDTIEGPLLDGNADQGRDDTLGAGADRVDCIRSEGADNCVHDQVAVAYDLQAVDGMALVMDLGQHQSQQRRVHALLLGRGGGPAAGRLNGTQIPAGRPGFYTIAGWLGLKGANVTGGAGRGRIGRGTGHRTGQASLVSVEGAVGGRDGVDGRAARKQGACPGRATIRGQRSQQGIADMGRGADIIPGQVVGVGADGGIVAQEAVARAVASDDTVAKIEDAADVVRGSLEVHAATVAARFVAGDGAVGHGHDAAHLQAATIELRMVAADGAVDEIEGTGARDLDAATIPGAEVATDGAVDNDRRPNHILDAAATAPPHAVLTAMTVGDVVADLTAENGQRAIVHQAPTSAGNVVAEAAILEGKHALIQDAAARLRTLPGMAVANGHGCQSYGCTRSDAKDAVGGIVGAIMSLHNGLIDAQATYGDALADQDASFGVKRGRNLDDTALKGLRGIEGSLDGGEVAAAGTDGVIGKGRSRIIDGLRLRTDGEHATYAALKVVVAVFGSEPGDGLLAGTVGR